MVFLSPVLRWLLQVPANSGNANELFYLAAPWKPLALTLFAALSLAWFSWLYYKDGTRPSWVIKSILLACRLVVVALAAALLMQPMLRLTQVELVKPVVAVAVDVSQSMDKVDARLPVDRLKSQSAAAGIGAEALSRRQVAERMLSRKGGLLEQLSDKATVRLYQFAGESGPIEVKTGEAPKFGMDTKLTNTTQLGSALHRILQDVSGQTVAGVLAISDGGNNLGGDPVQAAQELKAQGTKVNATGLGDPTPTRDLAVTDVIADQVVRKDNLTRAYVGLEQRGYAGQRVAVTLRRGNAVVQTKQVLLGPDRKKQTITFDWKPSVAGKFAYSVSVAPLNGEVTPQNNQRRFDQEVVTKRLKILYVEGEPRWEFRYLKNAILRDKQIDFSCLLTSSKMKLGGEGNVRIFEFPQDEKSMFAYDIFILGDVPKNTFSITQLRLIRRFVEDKGGSLIAIAGEKHMPSEYQGTPIMDVLPVVMPGSPEQVRTFEPFQWELTGEGRREPMLRMDDDPGKSVQIWAKLSGMNWQAGAVRAKPGATVLAVNNQRSNAYGKRVVLAIHRFGAGRCLASLADSTWKWRYRVGDRYFYRYWGHVIRSMTPVEVPGGNRFAQINPDRPEYVLGEQVTLNARLLDSFYRPVKANRVEALVKPDSGGNYKVTLNAIPGSEGLYAADLLADRNGQFTVEIASPANPVAIARTTFRVQSLDLERQQPELNEALLMQVAKSGGGEYYLPDQLDQWVKSLKLDAERIRSEREIELFDAPALLGLCVLALTLEWLIRKRTGLL